MIMSAIAVRRSRNAFSAIEPDHAHPYIRTVAKSKDSNKQGYMNDSVMNRRLPKQYKRHTCESSEDKMFTNLLVETQRLQNTRRHPLEVDASLLSQPLSRTWRRQRRVSRLARVPLAA